MEYDKTNRKLSKLYDSQLEGKASERMFITKQKELKEDMIKLKSQLDCLNVNKEKIVKKAEETFEVMKSVENLYNIADNFEKADIIRLIATSYVLDGKKIKIRYKPPFNYLAKLRQNLSIETAKMPDLKSVFNHESRWDLRRQDKKL
jgi:hypothetical protein